MTGYCPHCGHQVEIGECPKCGLQVTPERILRKPPKQKRRKRLVIWLASLAAAGLIGYVSYEYAPWASKLPTSWLATLQSLGEINAERELFGRLLGGKLSKTETDAALDRLIDFQLIDRPPYTHDGYVGLNFQSKMSLDGVYTRHWIYLRDVVVLVDGKQRKEQWTFGSTNPDGDNLQFVFDPMPVGRRIITLQCRAILAPYRQYGIDLESDVIYERQVKIEKAVDIDSRGADHFFKPVKGPDVIQATRGLFILYGLNKTEDNDGKQVTHRSLWIQNKMSRREPISGKLYARPYGKGDYIFLTDLIEKQGEEDRISLERVPEIANAARIDVKIEPSPIMMVYYGHANGTQYIGEKVERLGLSRQERFVFP